MDFTIDPAHAALVERVREFVDTRLVPLEPTLLEHGLKPLLGKVGGEMMITDPVVHNFLHPTKFVEYGVMIFFTIGVVVVGRFLMASRTRQQEIEAPAPIPMGVQAGLE